ncbi:MAG TPA: S8 family serine peptidase [Allosphingosinicella sp.]|jgi:subtilisin family serine protease
MDEDIVESFGAGAPPPGGSMLDDLRDPATGKWLRIAPNAPLGEDLTGKGTVCAIVDSGLAAEHPTIAARLDEQVDFSGEGIGDRYGHGTTVALIFLAAAPEARLVDVKVSDARGRSKVSRMIQGLEWIGRRGGIRLVNASCGAYRPACRADCDLCTAARALVDQGILVVAAAGNRPGLTACPAKAVISVAESDPETGSLTSTSSPAGLGGVVVPRMRHRMIPAEE